MGGFELDASTLDSERPDRLRLRPHVLIELANEGKFEQLNIAADELTDKSKFDILGSTIAFVQALWFCAQSIARVQQGLAISLLEVSTVAHVVMSSFTLILWWQKPQSVARGHIIMRKPMFPQLKILARYEQILGRSAAEFSNSVDRKEHYFAANHMNKLALTAKRGDRARRRGAMREAVSESQFLRGAPESLWMFHIDQSRELRDKWFAKDLYYWSSAAFWAVVALYGAVHVAAWNNHFPSSVERILWLVASVVITSVASLYGFGSLIVMWVGSERWKNLVPSPNGPPVRYAHVFGSLAILSHLYISVESWASIRSLDESAFQTVNWLEAFPHLS